MDEHIMFERILDHCDYSTILTVRMMNHFMNEKFSIMEMNKSACDGDDINYTILFIDSIERKYWHLVDYILDNHHDDIDHCINIDKYIKQSSYDKSKFINIPYNFRINYNYIIISDLIGQEHIPLNIFIKFINVMNIKAECFINKLLNKPLKIPCEQALIYEMYSYKFLYFTFKKDFATYIDIDKYYNLMMKIKNFNVNIYVVILRCLSLLKKVLDHDPEYDEFLDTKNIPKSDHKNKLIDILFLPSNNKNMDDYLSRVICSFLEKYAIKFEFNQIYIPRNDNIEYILVHYKETLGEFYP